MRAFTSQSRAASTDRQSRSLGFSMVELCVVMAVIIITTAISLPMIRGALTAYTVNSAVSSVTGAIQTTRYRALQNGYPFEITFTKSNSTYQILSDVNNSGTFVQVGNTEPISTTKNLLGAATTTLVLHPGGSVQCPACTGTQLDAAGDALLTITYSNAPTETITVSPYGRITVTP